MNLNKLYLFILLICISCTKLATAQLVINEYSCANNSTILDNFNEYEDWFELYNGSGAAINLTGYYLSDDVANPTKWQIPSGNIANNGFILYFASKRNQVAGGFNHTNFKLTQTNAESIVLSDPSGTVIDVLTITKNQLNHSTGRAVNGGAAWNVFPTPTPNASNAGGFAGYMPLPTFSVAAGFYGGAQLLTITCSDPNSQIRYTNNGSDPSNTSALYAGPINVSNTQMIRARCYSTGATLLPSFIETNTYFINVTHTLPVVSVGSGDYTALFNSWGMRIPSTLEYFDKTGQFQFEGYGESDKHGNDSWAYPQKGIDYVVRDEYGYNEQFNYQIFHTKTRQKFQRIILKAAASDNYIGDPNASPPLKSCHIRDAFIQSLSERAGLAVDYRASENCILYINGQYWGVYELREKVGDPDYTDYYYGQKEEDLDFLSYWGSLNVRYGSAADWNNLYAYIMANSMAVPANYTNAAARIDVNSVIDYVIINTFSVNSDWMNWNTMWWRGNGAPAVKWKYALWDMDNTFNLGQNYSGWPQPNGTTFNADPCALDAQFANAGPNEGHLDIFNALMDNPDFKSLYINRYAQLINGYLSCNYALNFLDSMVTNIAPEMPAQIARWGGNIVTWQNYVQLMKDQITGRCSVIEQGIIDCYNVTGPFPIMVDVSPVASGTVAWNTVAFPTYPNTADYFGNINATLQATPLPGFNFSYWEIKNQNLGADTLVSLLDYPIISSDTIIAHFVPDIVYDLTVIADVPNGGTVAINGTTLPLPLTNTYVSNAPVNLSATPNPGYRFVKYLINHNTLAPNDSAVNVFFNIQATDTVIAIFEIIPVYTLTLSAYPLNAGNLTVNTVLTPLPVTTIQNQYDIFSLEATPEFGFQFVKYDSRHHTLAPNDSALIVNFTMLATDTIIAIFKPIDKLDITLIVEPKQSGSVDFNYLNVVDFPYLDSVYSNTVIALEAKPYETYNFSHWQTNYHSSTPDTISEKVTCNIIKSDTIVAYFKLKDTVEPTLFIPLSFSPNNDGINDDFKVAFSSSVVEGDIKIFDRWGSLMFSSSSLNFKWAGPIGNGEAVLGVYPYVLNYTTNGGEVHTKRGNVTILK